MQTIYTWGYHGSTHDRLRQLIAEHGIKLVIDVRRDPWGGLCQWREGPMLKAFSNVYHSRPILGNQRGAALGEWRKIDVALANAAIGKVYDLYRRGDGPVLLLCCEADAADCHRKHVAEAIAEGTELQIVHLPGKAAKAKTGNLFAEEGAL